MWTQDERQTTVTSSPLRRALWICAVRSPFVVVGVAPIAIAIQEGAPEFVPIGIVALGAVLLFMRRGYRAFRQWQAFGPSHLQLETAPVPVGTTLRARVQVPVPPDDSPQEGYQVHVEAHRDKHQEKERVWDGSTTVQGESGEGATTGLSFSLDLPSSADLPVSPDRDDLGWTLTVTASFEDRLDYEAPFELPVSAGHDGDERPEDESDASPDTTEEAFWDTDDEEAGLRRADDGGDAGETEDEGTDTGSTDPQ